MATIPARRSATSHNRKSLDRHPRGTESEKPGWAVCFFDFFLPPSVSRGLRGEKRGATKTAGPKACPSYREIRNPTLLRPDCPHARRQSRLIARRRDRNSTRRILTRITDAVFYLLK